MRAVAARNIGGLARLGRLHPPACRRASTPPAASSKSTSSVWRSTSTPACGQAIDQQALVLVLRKDQRVGERAEARAHVAEDGARHLLAGHPEIRRRRPSVHRSTTASARPIWRYSSSVRACTASAREVVPGSAVLSTILTRTPSRVSHRANTRPVGPAPTMRTSVSRVERGVHRLESWRRGGSFCKMRALAARGASPGVAPRPVRRPVGKARRPRISGHI